MKPTDKSKFSKVLYNDGIKPVVVKKTLRENIVIQVRRWMRLENKVADDLLKKNKCLMLYEDYLKREAERKEKAEEVKKKIK